MAKRTTSLAIAILIGGKSSRFGSDKGLYETSGKLLISYQLETLGDLKYDIFLVAKSIRQVSNYLDKIDLSKINGFIVDELDSKSGKVIYTPMIGLYSTFKELNRLKYKKVLVLSCDSPFIKINVLSYLIEQCKTSDCCIPQWSNGFLEPLIAIYPINKGLVMARNNLKDKKYRLTNLISSSWNTNFISIEREIKPLDNNLLTFININEPIDIKKLREKKILKF
ncbi:MAG: molybdenum cofactor guanylyltransferase [Promethearchaeota archaeon]